MRRVQYHMLRISSGIYKWSLDNLKKEVEKCVVVCSNCHRKLHNSENKWMKEIKKGRVSTYKAKMFVWNYKLSNPCSLCGEKDPLCLDFHHIGEKTAKITKLVNNGVISKVQEEINKCIVLCSNCHRKQHPADSD
jgi:ribosomal protein L30E